MSSFQTITISILLGSTTAFMVLFIQWLFALSGYNSDLSSDLSSDDLEEGEEEQEREEDRMTRLERRNNKMEWYLMGRIDELEWKLIAFETNCMTTRRKKNNNKKNKKNKKKNEKSLDTESW